MGEFGTHAALHLEVEGLVIILWSVGLVFALDPESGCWKWCCALRLSTDCSFPAQSLDAFHHSQDSLDPLSAISTLKIENKRM